MTDDLEKQLRTTLRAGLDAVPVTHGDLSAVRRRGGRQRTLRALVVSGSVLVIVGGLFTAAGLLRQQPAPSPIADRAGWVEVARSPLSPRWSAVAAWTGTEMLVIGGGDEPPCPPNAYCVTAEPMTRDGAAYNPISDTWRRIANAPVDIGPWFRPIVVDGDVVLRGTTDPAGEDEIWLRYEVESDAWTELRDPPTTTVDQGELSVLTGEIYTLSSAGAVVALDPSSSSWRSFPRNAIRPRIEAQHVLATPDGVFVTGPSTAVPEDGDTPRYVVVDRWDGERWSRVGTTGQIGASWHWTGSRLLNADPQVAPGLDGQPPYGGVLDPTIGTWSPLPNAPDVEREGFEGWSAVAADGPLVAGWGALYDDRDGSWTDIGRPSTAVERPAAAVWANGELLAFGGIDPKIGYGDPRGLSNQTWVWHPPTRR